ncbi:hypothetical protein [Spartinivicinus ruber]|uniref:hypothetical protein n=1 Tax=Spartinivicinus ruber TaxID=2683272 RepID=UPI0013D3CA47|nr:hypothetical protein [Spartinivicinus ruber]
MAAKTDWESIEKEYRAGQLSIRAIANKYNVSDTAIRKQAKKDSWQRDLTEKVRKATKSKLVRSQVCTKNTCEIVRTTKDESLDTNGLQEGSHPLSCSDEVRTEEEIIDLASERAKDVVLRHMDSLEKCQEVFDKIMDSILKAKITDKNRSAIARDYNNCTNALSRMIATERKAYNLDEEKASDSTQEMSELMDLIAQEETEAGPLGR